MPHSALDAHVRLARHPEIRACEAPAATATGAPAIIPPDTSSQPPGPRAETVPVYAGDPGDHEALPNTFLESQGEWEKYRTWSDETTHVGHESLSLRVEFIHDTEPGDTMWHIASYASPVGERLWQATAINGTSVELVAALLDSLPRTAGRGEELASPPPRTRSPRPRPRSSGPAGSRACAEEGSAGYPRTT